MSNVPLSFVDTPLCLLKSIRRLELLRDAHLDSFRRASLAGEMLPLADSPEPTADDVKRWSRYDRIYRGVLSIVHLLLDFDSVTDLHNGYMALLLGGEVPPELRDIFRGIRKLDQDQAALASLAEAVQPVAAELGITLSPEAPTEPHGNCETRNTGWTNRKSETLVKPTYPVGSVAEMAGVSNTTLNKYAKKAQVTTPSPGKRNHTYTAHEVRAILKAIIDLSSDSKMKQRCSVALNNLEKPK